MIEVRRLFTQVEAISHEFGPPPAQPLLRGAVCIVMTNPYAGRYEANILPMMDALEAVGVTMAEHLRAAMDVPAEQIQGYGKGAIVGASGELEHGALWHVPGGNAMRTTRLEGRSQRLFSGLFCADARCAKPDRPRPGHRPIYKKGGCAGHGT